MHPAHDDSYLWDKTGEVDPEFSRWEELLAQFSSPAELRPLPFLPARQSREAGRIGETSKPPAMRWLGWAAAVICLLILTSALVLRIAWQPGRDWTVTSLSGAPTIDHVAILRTGRLTRGELLETDNHSRAMLRTGLMAKIEVEPNTKLRISQARPGHRRLFLETGRITARVWAPPASLLLETPSATAVDLGCAFSLQVDERGSGDLRVHSGWVEVELDNRQAIVPAGAMVLTRNPSGPGTPFFEDARIPFRTALEKLDFGHPEYQDEDALRIVLSQARPRDAITLLTLLNRLPPGKRGRVFDRAAKLVPPPPDLTRDDVVRGTNQHALDEWWRRLGLGDAKSWLLNWRDVIGS